MLLTIICITGTPCVFVIFHPRWLLNFFVGFVISLLMNSQVKLHRFQIVIHVELGVPFALQCIHV